MNLPGESKRGANYKNPKIDCLYYVGQSEWIGFFLVGNGESSRQNELLPIFANLSSSAKKWRCFW